MEASKTSYKYGITSTFAQLLAISGLCTLQIGLGVKEMFHLIIVEPKLEDQTWFGTLYVTCTLLGCVQSTLLLGRLGHRKCILLASLEYLVAELAAGLGHRRAWALMMALSDGASVGPCLAYVGEVCEPRLRSTVSAALNALKSISGTAIMIMFRSGVYSPVTPVTATAAAFPIATIAIMVFVMPDSPIWLLTKGEHVKARKTLGRLRGNVSDAASAQEFKDMVDYTFSTTSRNASSTSYATDEDDADNSSAWKQLLRPEVLRPFRRMICNFIAINLLVKMHSLYFIKFIYEYIRQFDFLDFEILIGVFLPLIGNVITVLLVNCLGKRLLTLFSMSTTSVSVLINSLPSAYKNYTWFGMEGNYFVSVVSFWTFVLMPSIGIEPISNMLITEIFPAKSRYITCNICPALILFTNFMLQFNYESIMNTFENYILLKESDRNFINLSPEFGIVGLMECLYLYFYQKETENKSLYDIHNLFN